MINRGVAPVYVETQRFALEHYKDRMVRLRKQKSHMRFACFCVTMATPLIIGCCFSIINGRSEMFLAAIIGFIVVLICAHEIWDKTSTIINDEISNTRRKIQVATDLLENYCYFGDTEKMWSKIRNSGKNPREEVYQWCFSNEIPAILAAYDDPMFGQFGMLISMPDEESLLFFKLKYLDKI